LNILNHVIFPAKIQISKPIDVSVFMFYLRMISMSAECEYDWYWKKSACSTEYEVCDSFTSLTRQQTAYSGSAGWYFRYQSILIQITYTYIMNHTSSLVWWENKSQLMPSVMYHVRCSIENQRKECNNKMDSTSPSKYTFKSP